MNKILMAAFVYSSALILLTQSLSLIYKSTKVPFFALGTIMTTGAYASYTCKVLLDLPVYLGYLVSLIIGMLLMLIMGTLIMEPLLKKERSLVEMTLATIGLMILVESLIQIYHIYIRVTNTNIMLKSYDFRIGEVAGVFPISTLIAISSFVLLRHFLKNTRSGCAVRAVWDNSDLAQVQGTDPIRSRLVIWLIAGGLAGLAGGIMTMWFHLTPVSGSWVMTSTFAAGLFGGFGSLGGSFIGGLAVGLGEILLVTWGQSIIGVWVGEYRSFVSFLTIVLILRIAPNGLFGQDIGEGWKRAYFWRANKKYILVSFLLLALIGVLFVNTCRINKELAREELFSEFVDYDLEIRERESGVTTFQLGNLTVFKNTLLRLNISKVYVEPRGSTEFTFYYIRNGQYWVSIVELRYYGLCQFKAM